MEQYKNIWTNKTVMLIEDDEVSQMLIKETLQNTGIQLLTCSSSQEVYQTIKDNPNIDLVLLDILLPDENGYILASYLRKLHPALPILAQTAYAMAHDREKCLEAGCNDYITKPIKPDILLRTISKYLTA